MKSKKITFFIIFSLLYVYPVFASVVAVVAYSKGNIVKTTSNEKVSANKIVAIKNNETIKTGAGAKAILTLNEGSQLIIYENTTIQFNFTEKTNNINLLSGSIWCLKKNNNSVMRVRNLSNNFIVEKAAFRISTNETLKLSNVYVSQSTISLESPSDPVILINGNQYRVNNGAIDSKLAITSGIELTTQLKQYFIPESGKIPIQIHAQLNPDYYNDNIQAKHAMIVSNNSNLVIDQPELRFTQNAIEFKTTIIGSGNNRIFVVMDAPDFTNGVNGYLNIKSHFMSKMKTIIIKTSRGNVRIKLAPKTNE